MARTVKDKNTNKYKKPGLRKRKRVGFKKGQDDRRNVEGKSKQMDLDSVDIYEVNRPIQRHTKEYLNVLTKKTDANEFSTPGADGTDGSAMILRPQPSTSHENENELSVNTDKRGRYNVEEGNILVEKSRLFKLLNESIQKHEQLGLCANIDLDLIDFEPWGLFSKAVLICKSCDFKSVNTKLYEEVPSSKPGRKAAAGNNRLQLLLQDMPIGQTEMQLLFAAVGLRAGSLSGMQKAAYKAAQVTEELAEADIRKWREFIKRVLADRGVLKINHFSAQYDVRYHGVFRASAKTPGPGARQATAALIETMTPECKCIGIYHENGMCGTGSRLRAKGNKVICGRSPETNHKNCTSTLPPGRSIRERDMGSHIAKDLDESGISVTHLCTDCDADGKTAFEEANRESRRSVPPLTWYKDLTHTSRNMKQKILKYKFFKKNVPFGLKNNGEEWNISEIADCKKALALDVPERVAITLKNLSEYYSGDTDKMYNKVDRIAAYMLLCYKGDHFSCRSAPLAQLTGCYGEGKKSWFKKSSNFMAVGVTKLNLNKEDTDFLKSVIGMKLSKKNIVHYERRATTSRCESLNKTISKSLPKQKSWPKTSKARAYSAIGRHNNSFENFLHMKCRAMNCPLPENDQGTKMIHKYQTRRNNIAEYQKKESTLKRRRDLRDDDRKNYYIERKRVTNEGDYHKFQYENALSVARDATQDLVNQNDTVPQPSTSSYENAIENATRANRLVRDVLQCASKHNSSEIKEEKKKKKKQRKYKKAIRRKNEAKNEARHAGTKTQMALRNEHSYGTLEMNRH